MNLFKNQRSLKKLSRHPLAIAGTAVLAVFYAIMIFAEFIAPYDYDNGDRDLSFVPPGTTDDAEQDFVNSGPAGFDRWDLFYPFAPKPMLVWPSDRDFYSTYSSQYIANG